MYKLIHLGKYAIENMAKVSKRKETITPQTLSSQDSQGPASESYTNPSCVFMRK